MSKAWAVFTVDPNGERQMLESFASEEGFTARDARQHAHDIEDDEMEKYGNEVIVLEGEIVETSQGPMFQERES